MRRHIALVLLVTGGLLVTAGISRSQDPNVNITPRVKGKNPDAAETAVDRRANIRVDTTLVLIPVAVLNPLGKFVTGLDKENFTLLENKVQQEILTFSNDDAPLSVGIVFDASGSMGSKLQMSRKAVAQFLKVANPEDEFFLVEFSNRPELVTRFTRNPGEIENRLTFVQSKGSTALLDGVYLAMNEMKKAHNPRKAILIISDGGDNSSRYTQTEVRNAVVESDTQIYCMGIFEDIGRRGRTPEEFSGPQTMNYLASLTGGRSFGISNVAELPDVAEKIAIELRNQYVLGFSPTNKERDGKYRRVEVKMAKVKGLPPLKPIYRTGYFAPIQ